MEGVCPAEEPLQALKSTTPEIEEAGTEDQRRPPSIPPVPVADAPGSAEVPDQDNKERYRTQDILGGEARSPQEEGSTRGQESGVPGEKEPGGKGERGVRRRSDRGHRGENPRPEDRRDQGSGGEARSPREEGSTRGQESGVPGEKELGGKANEERDGGATEDTVERTPGRRTGETRERDWGGLPEPWSRSGIEAPLDSCRMIAAKTLSGALPPVSCGTELAPWPGVRAGPQRWRETPAEPLLHICC
ncbi:hypothetical protein NDU88_002818 [Pleurodeles waltl]|uniref:Uncharacterized protein n=1 Tax=Pleurodeles waltl TaxID=8319 RepID=A0AAV7MQ02_PLEWA|nr:hypothetical protein NDU88_002818 [Pleurodeles waltl]